MVLDLTNIGQVQADKGLVKDALTGLHEFMHHFEKGGQYSIAFKNEDGEVGATDAKLTVDMWNYNDGKFDLNKFDSTDHTFLSELNGLNLTVGSEMASAKEHTYIWVATGEQFAGIQSYYDTHKDDVGGTGILGYNFALKNDINATEKYMTNGYTAIGTGSEYTGTFDGRDNRVIGLKVESDDGNAGIFDTIGTDGKLVEGATLLWNDSWEDALSQDAHYTDLSARISGGSENSQYYFSLGYLNNEGAYIGSGFKRYNLRANITSDLTKWLQAGVNVSLTHSIQDYPDSDDSSMNNVVLAARSIPSFYPVYERDPDTGAYVLDENGEVIGYKTVHLGKMLEQIRKGADPKEAFEKNVSVKGRFEDAVKVIDPRKE